MGLRSRRRSQTLNNQKSSLTTLRESLSVVIVVVEQQLGQLGRFVRAAG